MFCAEESRERKPRAAPFSIICQRCDISLSASGAIEATMLSDALQKAAKLLGSGLQDMALGAPQFGDSRYQPVAFDPANFHHIDEHRPHRALGFVDGGNREILHAPDFSVQLVRVCSVLFQNGERAPSRRIPEIAEFLCLARALPVEGRILYSAGLFPIRPTSAAFLPDPAWLTIDSRDDQLAPGRFRLDISVVGAAARRFSEWLVLSELIDKELEAGDIAVRDGTLQTAVRHEVQAASRAFSAAVRKGAFLTALAKTSQLLTSSGLSLLAAVEELSRQCELGGGSWFYHPLVKNDHPEHRAEIYACRLHPGARHVFRLEILRDQAQHMTSPEVMDVIAELAANSRDLSFPGYPFGLVDADETARVRRSEKEALAAILASALAENGCWKTVQRHISTTDAHDILDEI
jgi:hypothetical protein